MMMMTELIWTQKQPDQPGWYWTMRGEWDADPVIRELYQLGTMWVVSDADTSISPEQISWWAGPLIKPSLALCSHCGNEFTPDEDPITIWGGPMCEPCWERLGDE